MQMIQICLSKIQIELGQVKWIRISIEDFQTMSNSKKMMGIPMDMIRITILESLLKEKTRISYE